MNVRLTNPTHHYLKKILKIYKYGGRADWAWSEFSAAWNRDILGRVEYTSFVLSQNTSFSTPGSPTRPPSLWIWRFVWIFINYGAVRYDPLKKKLKWYIDRLWRNCAQISNRTCCSPKRLCHTKIRTSASIGKEIWLRKEKTKERWCQLVLSRRTFRVFLCLFLCYLTFLCLCLFYWNRAF